MVFCGRSDWVLGFRTFRSCADSDVIAYFLSQTTTLLGKVRDVYFPMKLGTPLLAPETSNGALPMSLTQNLARQFGISTR
jgi:hypothetical protein